MKSKLLKLALLLTLACWGARSNAAAGTAGVDLSEHNRLIDGNQVKKNYFFAYIETNKGMHQDAAFKENWRKAREAGLPAGAYLYLLPGVDANAQTRLFIDSVQTTNREVNALLKQANNKLLPPVVDLEDALKWKRAIPNVTKRVQTILACLNRIKQEFGADPIVYMSPSFAEEALGNAPEFGKFELWVAQYKVASPSVPKPWSNWRYWQWKNTGYQAGVSGRNDRDFDYFNGTLGNLHSLMCSLR